MQTTIPKICILYHDFYFKQDLILDEDSHLKQLELDNEL